MLQGMDDFLTSQQPWPDPTPDPAPDPAPEDSETSAPDVEPLDEAPVGGKPRAPRSAAPDRRAVRRIVSKALEVNAASKSDRELLAQILGTEPDPSALTVTLMTGKPPISAITDLLSVADEPDVFEAVTIAGTLGERGRLNPAWSLARALGLELPATIPAIGTRAASTFAKAVSGLSDDQRKRLNRVAGLLARG